MRQALSMPLGQVSTYLLMFIHCTLLPFDPVDPTKFES